MRALLKTCLYIIFIVSVITGLGDLIGGPKSIPGVSQSVPAVIDNELRCLAVFWIAFGISCLWITRNIEIRGHFIPAIAITLFISGVARSISYFLAGTPGTMFIVVMFVEFIIATIIYLSFKLSPKVSNSY